MSSPNQNVVRLSWISGLLLLVVLVLVNAVFARTFVRLDLTEEGLYTLGEGSRAILGRLEDPVTVKVFWNDVPETGEPQRRYLEFLLDEMRAASRGNLKVRWVDLEDEDGEKEASDAGVQKHGFQGIVEGEVRISEGYDSLVLELGDKKEVLDQLINQGSQLEYRLISALHTMTEPDPVEIALVTPGPAHNPFAAAQTGRFRALQQQLRSTFGVGLDTTVKLDAPVPPGIDVLVLVAPDNISEHQTYQLEQYMLRGGKVVVLLDPVTYDMVSQRDTTPKKSGLEDWLAGLGLTVEEGVVGDAESRTAYPRQVNTAMGQATELVQYPFWVLLRQGYLDQTNPATRMFDQVPMYWPAGLAIDRDLTNASGRDLSILARTTGNGFHLRDLVGVEELLQDPAPSETGEIPLAVLLQGPMKSFWQGKPAPTPEEGAASGMPGAPGAGSFVPPGLPPGETAPEDGSEAPDGASEAPGDTEGADEPAAVPPGEGATDEAADPEVAPPSETPADDGETENEEGEEDDVGPDAPERLDQGTGFLVVMTDAELVDDMAAYLGRRLGRGHGLGFIFVQNLIEWMGGSQDLLSLRAKAAKARQIDEVKAGEQKLITAANITAIPLLLAFAGLVVFLVRRYQQ